MHSHVTDAKGTAAELAIEIDVADDAGPTEAECDVLDRRVRRQKYLKRSGHVGDHSVLENDLPSLKNVLPCKLDAEQGEVKRIELHVTIPDRLDLRRIVAERHRKPGSGQAAGVKGSVETAGHQLAACSGGVHNQQEQHNRKSLRIGPSTESQPQHGSCSTRASWKLYQEGCAISTLALTTLVHNPLPHPVDRPLELRFRLGANLIQVRLRHAAHHQDVLFGHPAHDRVAIE